MEYALPGYNALPRYRRRSRRDIGKVYLRILLHTLAAPLVYGHTYSLGERQSGYSEALNTLYTTAHYLGDMSLLPSFRVCIHIYVYIYAYIIFINSTALIRRSYCNCNGA